MTNSIKNAIAACLTLAATTMLAGCDGSPSDADIKGALQRESDTARKQALAMAGSNPALQDAATMFLPTIHDAKKLGCSKDGGGDAYSCDVELTVSVGNGQPQTKPGKIRFVKGSNGWTPTK